MSDSGGERSEKATPERMRKVRQDGSLQRSQDVSAWVGLAGATVMIPSVFAAATVLVTSELAAVPDVIAHPDATTLTTRVTDALTGWLHVMIPMFAVTVLVALVVSAAQGGIRFRKVKFEVKQFNLATGLKRLFSGQTMWQGAKALGKSAVIALVTYTTVQSITPMLTTGGVLGLRGVLSDGASGANSLMRAGIAAGIVLAGIDVMYVMRRNRKHTRMTRQEVKEEHKRTEGDPMLKAAVRSKQQAMARSRMMSQVAQADVVVVNPTHVAVALRYEPGHGAPKVVAKGEGHVATRIRAAATEHNVPLIKDIPLARALNAACAVDQFIPIDLYANVARVFAFVMALKKRGASAGAHQMPPGASLPIPDTYTRRTRRQPRKARR